MKKVYAVFIIITIIISLSGCIRIGFKENLFESSWTFDERSHWHACTDAGCVDSKKDVAEHIFNEEVVSPTFEEQGYTLHTCETCSYQYKDKKTDILEHNYSSKWSSDEKNHWHACIDEGYEDLISDKAEHTPSKWIIDEEPTASKQGKKHKQCDVCGHRLVEETIDKISDKVDDNSNLIFTQLDTGNYSVKAKSTSLKKIVIPTIYCGKSVTTIEKYAFCDCSSLNSITIPDGVTSIGVWAFGFCTSLTSITIPNSVTSIGAYVFCNCIALTSVIIPTTVTSICDCAFYGCLSLTSITIPDSVTSIGRYAFGYCSSLTSITVPNRVNSIQDEAFRDCSSLVSIAIPNSVTSIGDYAFYRCSSLKTIIFDGTKEQWNTINKGFHWNVGVSSSLVIHCIDDDINL